MKRLFLILVCLPIFTEAQVYKAGTVYPYYYDINPDTLLNITGNNSPTENYFFDVNNDLTIDYRMQAFAAGGLGGGTHYINITPLNANSFVRFGRIDSLWHNYFSYWLTTPMAKPLQLGDSINSKLSLWNNTSLYLTDNSGSAGTYTHPQDWININDLYIGIKYQDIMDTVFGWIRINCPNMFKCYIKDFSMSKCLNFPSVIIVSSSSVLCSSESVTLSASGANSYTWSTGSTTSSIVVTPTLTTTYTLVADDMYGCSNNSVITVTVNACIGIKENQSQQIKFYPNPVSQTLHITDSENIFQNSQIEITNYLVQTVLKMPYADRIDVSKLTQGIYTMKILTNENQSFYSKFIKE